MKETVNHPDHYQGAAAETRGILSLVGVPSKMLDGECIDAIEAMNAGFHDGNAIKYLWRCGQKGSATEDLAKAHWYLMRWIDQLNWFERIVLERRVKRYRVAIEMINRLSRKIFYEENA